LRWPDQAAWVQPRIFEVEGRDEFAKLLLDAR
jgi:hypothetical protein